MKKTGILLITLSILIVFLAFNMDVVVGTTYNIGLLNERQNIVYLSGILFLAGIILFGFGVVTKEDVNVQKIAILSILISVSLLVGIKIITNLQEINRQNEIQLNIVREQKEKVDKEIALKIKLLNDYTNGVVSFGKTGLMWQKCAIGQTWTGKWCNGNSAKMTWEEGMKIKSDIAGYNDWRLPTIEELKALIVCPDGFNENEGVCHNGYDLKILTINTIDFPNTPRESFGSSSEDITRDDYVWQVYFGFGSVFTKNKLNGFSFRLVRNI